MMDLFDVDQTCADRGLDDVLEQTTRLAGSCLESFEDMLVKQPPMELMRTRNLAQNIHWSYGTTYLLALYIVAMDERITSGLGVQGFRPTLEIGQGSHDTLERAIKRVQALEKFLLVRASEQQEKPWIGCSADGFLEKTDASEILPAQFKKGTTVQEACTSFSLLQLRGSDKRRPRVSRKINR